MENNISITNLNKEIVSKFLPQRVQISNKGTYGKILNVSGSEYMTGAAILSSISALKVGAGYVELASHPNTLKAASYIAPEIVLAPVEKISQLIPQSTILTIGCGLSQSNEAVEIFINTIKLAKKHNIKTVIDADGLNILSKNSSPTSLHNFLSALSLLSSLSLLIIL